MQFHVCDWSNFEYHSGGHFRPPITNKYNQQIHLNYTQKQKSQKYFLEYFFEVKYPSHF
ncbi:uncharacterized protein BDZ83DRAFT_634630 [Colletotrichum acutatum]|uniref:Uncharacterized protein n=1 Tax=Glomerella acutata TaxID=27357 RepID=A0AAD8UCU8_GLOAC|nr:uncharacterized protein BDZ83DRAFT_634630 [Colletotrichum acutatum]KAK1716747.1 hypothetical protein BDZ83DRAFT_634630 [Colletotrichum acutatum]